MSSFSSSLVYSIYGSCIELLPDDSYSIVSLSTTVFVMFLLLWGIKDIMPTVNMYAVQFLLINSVCVRVQMVGNH